MDFGGFILFGLLTMAFIGTTLFALASIVAPPLRHWTKTAVGVGVVLALLSMFMGRYLYQVYWLDEKLFIAAQHGDVARVKALLAAGADPNATWEDGTSALRAAQSAGRKEVAAILERAGAIE